MPTVTEMFPGKFLKAGDLQGRECNVKITHVKLEEVGDDKKWVVYFAGKERGLVLNVTNTNSIVDISGWDNTDEWTGCEICIYPTRTDYAGKQVDAIRVKAPTKQQARRTPVQQAEDDIDESEPATAPQPRVERPAVRQASADIGRPAAGGNGQAPAPTGQRRQHTQTIDMNDEIPF